MTALFKFTPALILWIIFIVAVFQIPYPENLAQADFTQISSFFIPLFLALIFTINIFLKNILISLSISLGLIFLLILKSLDSLNLVTGILISISIYLLVSYFKKSGRGSLTYASKIPKLSSLQRNKH